MPYCCTFDLHLILTPQINARTEIAKFGDSIGVSVDSGVCDDAAVGSCALALCTATSASRAGKARVVAEHGVGERRASHLRTQCERRGSGGKGLSARE